MSQTQEADVKERVRQFYDQVGWQPAGDGHYQNARYEDLRTVSQEYIHRCHMRVMRYLRPAGRFLLDAGSGPVQYPEYLAYSAGYQYRVCADISIVALQEARHRLGARGLFVVADVANLPFAPGRFEGVVSLHTLHHLPLAEQVNGYYELYRVLHPGCSAVVVNGWTDSPLMRRLGWLVTGMERLSGMAGRLRGRRAGEQAVKPAPADAGQAPAAAEREPKGPRKEPVGTFVRKLDAPWLRDQVGREIPLEIFLWRSVSVRFLRAVVHPRLGGRLFLRLLYRLEELFPGFFGEKGQYPLIVLRKPYGASGASGQKGMRG